MNKEEKESCDRGMLSDRTAPAARHRLVRLEERPPFLMDSERGSFARAIDLDDRGKRRGGSASPVRLEETKPE